MVVVFDNNVLCLLLHPDANVPNDPSTGREVSRAQDRMGLLVETIRQHGQRILIPAPVLSEFLTFADSEYLDEINASQHFEVAPFGQSAAIEAAVQLRADMRDTNKGKRGGTAGDWQKVKIDRQIVAIAKVAKAACIYTTDADLKTLAQNSGIRAVHVADLDLPESNTPLLDAAEGDSTVDGPSSEGAPPSGHTPDGTPPASSEQ